MVEFRASPICNLSRGQSEDDKDGAKDSCVRSVIHFVDLFRYSARANSTEL
jgi:hypothetical protein